MQTCETDPINIYGRYVFLGLDFSQTGDLTALYAIYPLENEKFYVDGHSFVATVEGLEAKSQRDKIDYQMRIDKGYATKSNLESGFINIEQVDEEAAEQMTKKK